MGRSSGVTIPLFSLRTRTDWGIGEIVDLPACAAWLARAGQRLVQVLPAHELADGETSPYGALSAFALDPIYIALARVPELDPAPFAKDIERVRALPRVDYKIVRSLKRGAFEAAFATFRTRELRPNGPRAKALFAFVEKERAWLGDHALYMALRHHHDGHGWSTWPAPERDRAPEVLALAREPRDDGALGTRVLFEMYLQWIAHEQWRVAREELRALGVQLMGDMPFIVGGESADVWARKDEFRTDVSLGAPPDAFTQEGQSWGLPAYDWKAMDATGLAWIRARAKHASVLFDRFRIDHVVGFFRQWVQKDGKGGFTPELEPEQLARGTKVLRAMIAETGPGAVIAEDLGVIPPFVRQTLRELGVPGYKVLPWERDGNFMPFDPRGYPELSVATWSTHDTPPITGWWDQFEPWERERLAALDRIPLDLPAEERELALLKLLFSSKSDLTLVLVNELLGDESRINTPGTVNDGNWTWRLARPIEELRDDPALGKRFDRIRALVAASARATT
ncbi:MAG TPA: 4-alpha-glucanotransferase [Labilithrix sp.]